VFILMRGELLQLDVDRETTIAKIPEGSVFGETVVLRNLEVLGAVTPYNGGEAKFRHPAAN
jgi:hypothetical protein